MVWSAVVFDSCFLMLMLMLLGVHEGPRWVERLYRVMIAYVSVELVFHGPMEWAVAQMILWWRG